MLDARSDREKLSEEKHMNEYLDELCIRYGYAA